MDKKNVLDFDLDAEQKQLDMLLLELREMGLQRVWLDVCEAIGADNMLKMWRILDSDRSNTKDEGRLLVSIRRYSTFLRYQRNRYIESLNSIGMNPKEIHKTIKDHLCEHISIRSIARLIQPREPINGRRKLWTRRTEKRRHDKE